MHKTTIFIIQLCVVFELFAIKAVKRHFRLDFVTSRWVKAIIDFHWIIDISMIEWSVFFFRESFVGSNSSLVPLIDQTKGQYGNMLDNWRLESMEIVTTVWIKAAPFAW